jgi:hypothetical protein
MITKVLRRRRIVKFAVGLASGMLVVSAATGLAVYAATGAGHASHAVAGAGTRTVRDTGTGLPVQLAAGTKTPVSASPGDGAPASPAALAGVPWRQVGPGWELVEYTTRTQTQHGPTTLYLIGPGGTHYALYTWRASATWAPNLIDWSGDKARALLSNPASGQYEQITLATGAVSHIQLAGGASAIGYTRPSGLSILGSTSSGTAGTIARYSAGGQLVRVLARGTNETSAIYSADGTRLVVSTARGLELVSNAGGVIRSLPGPGTGAQTGCGPVRWWNPTTILALCSGSGTSMARLWLVPAGGTRPVALTPQRSVGSNGDFGDIGAWQLPSGLYLQSLGACGTLHIFRQAANGSITPVFVPNTTGNDNYVATALGSRLLIEALTSCEGSHSLLWYDPGTHAEQWLLRAPAGDFGVTAVVPYYTRENSPQL